MQPAETGAISAILGMGGIGKTKLALQYALHQQELQTYPGGICWLKAREDLGSQVISFARSHLDLSVPEDLEFAARVAWCWQHWPVGATLLVLNDVQSAQISGGR